VGLERGQLSLVGTTEKLFERKSSGSGLERRDYGRGGSAALTTPQRVPAKVHIKLLRLMAVARSVVCFCLFDA
jgi:hypothetical protein